MAKQKTSRKAFATTAAAVMAATAVTPVAAFAASTTSFPDVPAGEYADAINNLAGKGILNGFDDGTFKPNDPVLREQAAKILATALKLDTTGTENYPDVSPDNWSYKYIVAVTKAGIFGGDENGNFNPFANLTRQEAAKIIVKAFDFTGSSELTFGDKANIQSWAVPYVKTAVANGILKGDDQGNFNPNANIKRGDFALMIQRALNAVAAPQVESVSAINSTQAVVTFSNELGTATATNFTVDNGLTVIKAEINPENKKQVTLTFNKALVDKTTYKVTANGVTSVGGAELKEDSSAEFQYLVDVAETVQLKTTKFYNGDNILDAVVVKDKNGLQLDNSTLNIELSSTNTSVVDTNTGEVSGVTAPGSFYVEVKVKNGDEVIATTGAVKVDVAPSLELSSLDGVTIAADDTSTTGTDESVVSVAAYKNAKTNGNLKTSLKVDENLSVLNVFAKDAKGNIVAVDPSSATTVITNQTPTVANLSVSGSKFIINTIAPGTAKAKIKVGDFETEVTFTVVANSKVADATLSDTSVTLDTSTNNYAISKTVSIQLKDQYNKNFALPATSDTTVDGVLNFNDGSKITVTSSNTNIATATIDANGDIVITKAGTKGTANVSVQYKDADGKVVFTKSIAVTAKDFDAAVAKYDLVITSTNTVLDADNDANETGADDDDSITFVLNKLDKYGNVIGQETFDGSNVKLTATASVTSDQDFFAAPDYTGTTTGVISFDNDAAYKLVNTGTLKVVATVNGVAVDTVNVTYKNTDSVAKTATVNTANRVIDLSQLGIDAASAGIDVKDLVVGKLNATNTAYALNSILTLKDQNGNVIAPNWGSAGNDAAYLTDDTFVDFDYTVTNLDNVQLNSDTLSLVDAEKSGTATVVITAIKVYKDGSSATLLTDKLLDNPVSFNVTLVK
ncbi:S-layer homology domain-containing protein [Caldifermentibacillus hisashii]|uniref:S-layer homology domain-containing protein n=1 Tax=Caldifermentibacillus hisashii TaxID=996558 RepID=UPI0034D46049